MPVGLGQTFETQPVFEGHTFTSADTTVAKPILAAQTGPFRVDAINITSDDVAAQVLDVFVHVGATNSLLGSVSVPAGSGKNGVAPVEFFGAIMPVNENGMNMPASASIQCALEATMTAAKTITVAIFGGLY